MPTPRNVYPVSPEIIDEANEKDYTQHRSLVHRDPMKVLMAFEEQDELDFDSFIGLGCPDRPECKKLAQRYKRH